MALQRAARATSAAVPKVGPDYSRFIASRQATEWGYASLFGEDAHPSKILADHSEAGERTGELYERVIRNDAVVAGLLEKRTKAVVGLPWDVVPFDESPEAQEVAEFVRQMLWRVRNLEANLAHQLGGIFRGVAFDELVWGQLESGPYAGKWTVVDLIDRPMWRFGFKDGELHVRTKDGGLKPVPAGKVLHFCHGTKDNPWGEALLDRVWWTYFLSLHIKKYWSVAVEKWAQPTVKVKYRRSEQGTDNEATVAAALAIGADIQTEYAVALPEDIDVDLLQAMQAGTMSYESFLAAMDREKANLVIGEVDTSGMAKGPGSYAKSRVSDEVRYETILADATELANGLTDGLITPLVRVNFGADAPVPYFEFDVEEAEDREQRQKGAQVIFEAGYPVPKTYYYRLHQVPMPKAGEATMRGPWQGSRPTPAPAPDVRPAAAQATTWADLELAS